MGLVSHTLWSLLKGREHGIRAGLRRWVSGGAARPASTPREPDPRDTLSDVPVPSGFTSVMRAGDLPAGELVEVMVDGQPVVLCKVEGQVHAISGVCPHAGGPLGDGTLDGHTLTCPYHGWSFDVRDGQCHVTRDMDVPVFEVDVGAVIAVRT